MIMGVLSWLTGVGLPSLVGFALLAAAAVAWLRIPVFGQYFGLVLACVGCLILGNARGFSDCLDSSKVNAIRAELANAKRDLAISQHSAELANSLHSKLSEAERRNAELASKITGDCLLGDDNARRLQRIQ
jgi:hypothetical protein